MPLLGGLLDASGFPPRWACGAWSDLLGWTHVVADLLTWAAYMAIPLVLAAYFRRRPVPVPPAAWLFVAFILACGITHLIEAAIFWWPVYRLSAVAKVVTASVSLATVHALIRTAPRAFDSPAFEELVVLLASEQNQRRAAEARSRHLAVIVERSSDMIAGLDASGRVLTWNAGAEAALGYRRDEMVGQPLSAIAVDRAAVDGLVGPGAAEAAGASLELSFRTRAGSVREMELGVAAIGDEPGNPLAAAVIGRDVTDRNEARRAVEAANRRLAEANQALEERVAERTHALRTANAELAAEVAERRAAEASLRASEAKLEKAHRMAGLGSWSYDPKADRISWSTTLYELFEIEPGRDLGNLQQHLVATYTEEAGLRLARAVEAALTRAEPYELELERRAGATGPRFILARGEAIVDETGEVVGLTGTVLDITQLKLQKRALAEANQRLEQAVAQATAELRRTVVDLEKVNADLERFVHMASHDLQEPLRALRTYSQLLAEDIGPDLPPDARDDLRFIGEASGRMHRMIEALIELSRTERSELSRAPIDLEVLVAGVLDDLQQVVRDCGAEVGRERPLPDVEADAGLLERVYSNLLQNALKFAGPSPRIVLTVEMTDAEWILGVDDSGPGVDPAHVDRAFQPFKRLAAGRDRPGMGMGLAICKRAVERHHGRIWIERGAMGGAHVRFALPRGRPG